VLEGARQGLEKFTVQVYYSNGGENGRKIQSHWTYVERQRKLRAKSLLNSFLACRHFSRASELNENLSS
jgi:hypothetical protein